MLLTTPDSGMVRNNDMQAMQSADQRTTCQTCMQQPLDSVLL